MSHAVQILFHCIPIVVGGLFIAVGFANLDPGDSPRAWLFVGMLAGVGWSFIAWLYWSKLKP